MKAPQHVAIIMDGNGRWAQSRGHKRTYGHVKGAHTARKIVRAAGQLGVKYLTLFTFSTENWKRPASEVSLLMKILEKYLLKELETLMKDNVRFQCIGNISKLPPRVLKIVLDTVEKTKRNSGLTLVFALNYGGRQELTHVMKVLAEQVQLGLLRPSDIDEDLISSLLQTSATPDPDLIIRTSGELRLSNFMMWQASYSELYFTPRHWPEFSEKDFVDALQSFSERERRFGSVKKTETEIFSPAVRLVTP